MYDWKDNGPDTRKSEMNFGVFRFDNTPKPGFFAAAAARRVLSLSSVVERLPVFTSGGNASGIFVPPKSS